MRYSVSRLVQEAFRGNTGFQPAWREPEPQPSYDVVIIGGGRHGLATAYYLAREHGERATARARLAHLVPLDLHRTRFGPGQCAQTLMAHMSLLLLQLAENVYELQGSRSFAGSFRDALEIGAASA